MQLSYEYAYTLCIEVWSVDFFWCLSNWNGHLTSQHSFFKCFLFICKKNHFVMNCYVVPTFQANLIFHFFWQGTTVIIWHLTKSIVFIKAEQKPASKECTFDWARHFLHLLHPFTPGLIISRVGEQGFCFAKNLLLKYFTHLVVYYHKRNTWECGSSPSSY